MNTRNTHSLPWKFYLTLTADSLLAFYLASFSLGMFITHRGADWMWQGILLGMLYMFVIFACSRRLIKLLPLPALMLFIPLVPLIAIFVIISLIPVLQLFK